jgi:hypothetical protein
MAEMNIERLTLKLAGISESDGQRLARLIAEGLASATISFESPRHIDSLRVNATASPGNEVGMLSRQIVAEIVRQLESTL